MQNLATLPNADRRFYENYWTEELARANLSTEDYQLWLRYNHSERMYLNVRGRLVHWQREQAFPTRLQYYRLHEVAVSPTGVTYNFHDQAGKTHSVGHVPTLLAETSIFVWVPHFSEIRSTPWVWQNASDTPAVRVSVCTRQFGDPLKVTLENQDCLLTSQRFDGLWSKYQNNRS